MACNCEGKKYNIGMGCCQPVLAPIENYYTKWQVDDLIESATTSGCCITPEEVDEKIASAKTDIEAEIPTVPTDISAFNNDVPYLTEHQSLSGYATEQWVEDKHYISGVDLSDYALKSEIPVVPTSNSAFTNDMGYLTEHQPLKTINGQVISGSGNIEIDCESGITSGEVQTMINNSINGKQDTLIAGDNITISPQNVISTVIKFWCGDSSAWSQISGGTLDSNTIYMVY